MKLVLDVSVGLKTIIPEPDSAKEGCPLLTADQKLMSKAPGFSYVTLDDL